MTNQPTRKRDALRVLAAITAVLLAVSAGAGAVAAVPSPPHEVFGTVTDQNGNPVADVTVSITDEDGNTVTTTTNADGYYEIKYPAEDGDDGETLTVSVKEQSWTTSFSSGTSEQHDFQVTVTTTTTAASGGGGGGGQGDNPFGTTAAPTNPTSDQPSNPTTTEAPTPTSGSTSDGTSNPATTEATGTSTATTGSANESGTTIPGFGVGIALVAVVAAALLALRDE